VLGLPTSRASELKLGKRRLLFDEGVKLIEAFEIESTQEPSKEALLILVERIARTMQKAGKEQAAHELAAALVFLRSSPSPEVLTAFLCGFDAARVSEANAL
jgi:hypothetical protein